MEELIDPECAEAEELGSFSTGNRASFCCLAGGPSADRRIRLRRAVCYGENPSDDHTRRRLEHSSAWVFPLDETASLGVREVPEAAVSLSERIQGPCLSNDGRVILSASSVLSASQLYLYDIQTVAGGRRGICFWDKSHPVPLFYVDSGAGTGILHVPPKAEELLFQNGKLYILFESASYRFQYGKLVGGNYVYSMSLPERGD